MTETTSTTRTTRAERLATPLARQVVRELAVEHGACIRPVQLRRTNLDTGQIDQVLVPCGHTLASVCPSCAERARSLRAAQCREGWHLEDEPDITPDPATEDQQWWVVLFFNSTRTLTCLPRSGVRCARAGFVQHELPLRVCDRLPSERDQGDAPCCCAPTSSARDLASRDRCPHAAPPARATPRAASGCTTQRAVSAAPAGAGLPQLTSCCLLDGPAPRRRRRVIARAAAAAALHEPEARGSARSWRPRAPKPSSSATLLRRPELTPPTLTRSSPNWTRRSPKRASAGR